tara:strand:+ start:636 stop:1685 length:1050 start_codon:yes stop_codon:yes gene_type:complete
MAVNVNTVYKTTLLILNKEQRGYITPNEFNNISVQVQREILEQYFEELNQQLRVPQNNDEYANRVNNLQEKIDIFQKFDVCTGTNPFTLPTDVHRLGMLAYREKEIQEINRRDYLLVNRSALTTPTTSNPVYILEGTGSPTSAPSKAYVYPDTITTGADVTAYYVKTPIDPRWGYSVGALGQYVYDSTPYDSTAGSLVVLDNSLTSSITTNTANGVNAVYTGTTFNTNAVTTSGSGTGAQLTVTVSGNVVTNVTVTSAGSGYAVGDTITISDSTPPNGIGGTTAVVITLTEDDLYSGSAYGSTDFELHPSEQPNIIMNILLYCGVVIRDPQIVQNAAQMIAQDEALEKS